MSSYSVVTFDGPSLHSTKSVFDNNPCDYVFAHGPLSLTRYTQYVSDKKLPANLTKARRAVWQEFERVCEPTPGDWILWMRHSELYVGSLDKLIDFCEATKITGYEIQVFPVLSASGFVEVGTPNREVRIFQYTGEKARFSKTAAPGPVYSHERTSRNITVSRLLDFDYVTPGTGRGMRWPGVLPKWKVE